MVLAIAYFGNIWEPAYPRNDNHHPPLFWLVNGFLAIGAFMTWTWKASSVGRSGGSTPRVVMLGREQTEEWKGWMQWAFIFYHYYRVYYVYNEIRLFVSAYVWMVSICISVFFCFCWLLFTFLPILRYIHIHHNYTTIISDWIRKLPLL